MADGAGAVLRNKPSGFLAIADVCDVRAFTKVRPLNSFLGCFGWDSLLDSLNPLCLRPNCCARSGFLEMNKVNDSLNCGYTSFALDDLNRR